MGAPDLVIEILSPKTARFDLGLKRQTYFRSGVDELWIIDPKKLEISVYRRGTDIETPVITLRKSDALTTDLLPGFTLQIETIFAGL